MSLQKTRFNENLLLLGDYLFGSWLGSWRRVSFGLITLLLGFYFGSTFTAAYLQQFGQRPIVVVTMVILFEILVRLRSRISRKPWPIHWLAIDNLRIGAVYALVLEAFKLGS